MIGCLPSVRTLAATLGLAGVLAIAQIVTARNGEASTVDLELILAVDTSSSVSAAEFDLQMRGLAEAFRHPAVLSSIQVAGDLGIAVSLVQWSDNRNQFVAVDWTRVEDAAAALAFADEISNAPRFLVGGGTAIGGALRFSMRQFERNGFEGRQDGVEPGDVGVLRSGHGEVGWVRRLHLSQPV